MIETVCWMSECCWLSNAYYGITSLQNLWSRAAVEANITINKKKLTINMYYSKLISAEFIFFFKNINKTKWINWNEFPFLLMILLDFRVAIHLCHRLLLLLLFFWALYMIVCRTHFISWTLLEFGVENVHFKW